jgi:EAL domain-containing protein (putative c-di-GMP-specific phosphodiesterase class I)
VVATRLLAGLSEPFVIDGRDLFVTGSIGISVFPHNGADVESLVRNADAAMYRAKEQGRNSYHWFTEDLNAQAMERVNIEGDLRRALEHDELALHYQMRVDLDTGLAPGVEALIRWHHPDKGMLPPVTFIPIAEDTDLISPITDWVLHTACTQNKAWQDSGFLRMDVGVNISPRILHRVDLLDAVQSALSAAGLEPRYLTLELTETAVMRDPEHAIGVLGRLRDMGVHLCIDDFGTGYSSLSLLKRLPIDGLKIDASFIRHLTTSRDDESIATAIVAMAHTMNLKVTAEGVETIEQLELLKELGCDEIQGYFISRPVPPEELVHLLAEGRPPLANWTSLAA